MPTPVITTAVLSPPDGGVVARGGRWDVAFGSDEGRDHPNEVYYEYRVDGGDWQVGDAMDWDDDAQYSFFNQVPVFFGPYFWTLEPGVHTFEARCTDSVGRTSEVWKATVTFTE